MSTSPNDSFLFDPHAAPVDIRNLDVNILISLLISLIAIMALAGNILVIFAVFHCHRLREKKSNLFIVNLSVTDLLSASVVMVSSVVAVIFDRWPMGKVWCSMVCGANYCFIIVSMLTLSLISLDRYMAIHYPLRHIVLVNKRKVLVLIAYTWLQGLAFGLAPILCDWVEYDYWEVTCAIQWYLYGNPVLIYVIVTFILCFMLPGVVITISYCTILRTAKKMKPLPQIKPIPQIKSIPQTSSDVLSESSIVISPKPRVLSNTLHKRVGFAHEGSKAVRSLLIVVLAFFICMTPFSVIKLYKVAFGDPLPGYASILATFFQFMSSAVNPFIYALFRQDFQLAFLQILCPSLHSRG
ncbi:alpha-1A adrenergic receptor-like [Littorina saxatilis]|uniref:G-protein coupled receptors family 1 profile domain-containing protein n=1 Tax=Littorina saxatilis TaxID=31220 RepID=A0AAN9GFP0_9CAEN